MKTDLFQSCGHCCFPNLLTDRVQHFTASSFRILNNSDGIESPPLALFIVMPNWLHTPGCLTVGEWPHHFGYLGHCFFAAGYSCCYFLISSASVKPLLFLSFIVHILEWHVHLISPIFLKRSLVFSVLLFSSISLHCSLRKAFSLLAIPCDFAFKWVYLSPSPLPFTSFLSYL